MSFDHAAHVRLAEEALRERPLLDAFDHVAATLQQRAADAGVPEKYSDAITRMWMHRIAGRMLGSGRNLLD